MSTVKIDITTVPTIASLEAKLNRLGQTIAALDAPKEESLNLLLERMTDYPPPPANSTYNRTGDLGNSWEVDLAGSRVHSDIYYGPFVQDYEEQASIHRGRWQTTQSVAAEEEDNIVGIYERAIDEAIRQ